MNQEIYKILGYISKESIYGIKLDIIAHLFFGTIIFVILKKFSNTRKAFIGITLIAILKEVHDTTIMTNTYTENIKDLIITLLIPTYLIYRQKRLIKLRNLSNK